MKTRNKTRLNFNALQLVGKLWLTTVKTIDFPLVIPVLTKSTASMFATVVTIASYIYAMLTVKCISVLFGSLSQFYELTIQLHFTELHV